MIPQRESQSALKQAFTQAFLCTTLSSHKYYVGPLIVCIVNVCVCLFMCVCV